MLALLESVRHPEGDSVYPTDWSAVDRRYAEVFAAHGLVLNGDEAAAIEQLEGRGIALELAAGLDDWCDARRRALDVAGAEFLTRVAAGLDRDALRNEVRAALATNDAVRLSEIAARDGIERLPPSTLILVARGLLRGRGAERALAVLGAARRSHPDDFLIAFEFARALRGRVPPRAAAALVQYEAALALRPQNVEVWHELGMTLGTYLGRVDETVPLFREIVARVPNDGHLHFHLGSALTQLGRDAEAVASLRRSIELEPDYALAHEDLGVSLDRLGRTNEALACYERALELNPQRADAHHNYAISLRKLERIDDAVAEFERTLELDPNFARAYTELAYIELCRARFEAAIAYAKRAIASDPKYAHDYLQLGEAQAAAGHRAEARSAYEECARLAPANVHARAGLVLLFLDDEHATLADAEATLVHARKYVELSPGNASAINVLGTLLYATGAYAQAREQFQRGFTPDAVDPEGVLFLGLCAWKLGALDEARAKIGAVDFELLDTSQPLVRRAIAEARAFLVEH